MDAFEREVAEQARRRAEGLRGMGFLAAAVELDAMAVDLELETSARAAGEWAGSAA